FALYDSRLICDYLNVAGSSAELIPGAGENRWIVLRAEALADGVLDAALACVMEGRRPADEQSPGAVARQKEKIVRALPDMQTQLALLPGAFNLGHLAFISALGYLDLRHPDMRWRDSVPALAQWFAEMETRPSVAATRPQ